jgi:hypothetical protein
MEAVIIIVIVAYVIFHHRHYRRHRRAGLTIRQSIPGPFGTYLSIGKRFRD